VPPGGSVEPGAVSARVLVDDCGRFSSCPVCIAASAAGNAACCLAGGHTCGSTDGASSWSSLSPCSRTVTCVLSRTSRALFSASRRRRRFCTSDVSVCRASATSSSVTCAVGSPKGCAGLGRTASGRFVAGGGFMDMGGVARPSLLRNSSSDTAGPLSTFGALCNAAFSALSKLACMSTFAKSESKLSALSTVATGFLVGLLGGIPGGFRWSPLKEVPSHGPLSKYWNVGDVGWSTLWCGGGRGSVPGGIEGAGWPAKLGGVEMSRGVSVVC